MIKFILILLIGLVFEATGVVLLSKGLKQIGDAQKISLAQLANIVRQGISNANILLGVLFEAIFFGTLLVLLSQSNVSFIWPLTSLGFVITTLAAQFILHEQVTWVRWTGVVLIMAGAALITWTEQSASHKPGATTEAVSHQ